MPGITPHASEEPAPHLHRGHRFPERLVKYHALTGKVPKHRRLDPLAAAGAAEDVRSPTTHANDDQVNEASDGGSFSERRWNLKYFSETWTYPLPAVIRVWPLRPVP